MKRLFQVKRKGMIITALVFVFYFMGIVSAIDAVMTSRTAPGAIAWSVALVTAPFVTVPAYWVLGRSKFEGFAEAYADRKDEIDALVADVRDNLAGETVGFDVEIPAYEAIKRLSGNEFTGRNRADLLIDGDATFASILDGIAAAEDYVLVQFYMIHDDGIGRRMQDEAFAQRMEAMFVADFAYSTPLDTGELDQRGFWWRLGVSVSRLASPVL